MADTLLLLDVDGVICPDPPPAAGTTAGGWSDWASPDPVPASRWAHAPGRIRRYVPDPADLGVAVSRTMGAQIGRLNVDVAWLTSWRHVANLVLCPTFGWDDLPVISWDDDPDHAHKAVGLGHWIDGGDLAAGGWRRVVWVDDELRTGRALDLTSGWVDSPFDDVDHLTVGTDPTVGLTCDDLDRIRAWVDGR